MCLVYEFLHFFFVCVLFSGYVALCVYLFRFYFSVYKRSFSCYNVHMKVTRNLEISGRDFFETVFQNLAQEIRSYSGSEADIADFKTGYRYIHHPEDPALKISFEIVEYQEDALYKAVRTDASGTIAITYELAPTETGITVGFTYENSAYSAKKRGIFSAFSDALFLGRMTDTLYGIQRDVINKREGFVERKSSSPFMPDIRKSK